MFKRVIIKTVGVSALCLMTLVGCSGDKPEVSEKGESDTAINISAINSKTLYTGQGSGSIAYRVIGSGHPLILCNRFRGTLDDWDPKFLDELAKSHTVVTFDYRGIGLSSLPDGTDTLMETQDVEDLTSMLGFNKFSLLGWSHGGKVAQIYAAKNASKVDHLVLLGTGPVGIAKFTPEKIFFDYALKPVNNFEDEIVLFFEPKYEESKIAARLSHGRMKERKSDTSKYVTPDKFPKYFQSVAKYNADKGAMDTLINGKMPILAVSGEHDIVFPVEDWYAQTKKIRTCRSSCYQRRVMVLKASIRCKQHDISMALLRVNNQSRKSF